jgi:hypothetical protein
LNFCHLGFLASYSQDIQQKRKSGHLGFLVMLVIERNLPIWGLSIHTKNWELIDQGILNISNGNQFWMRAKECTPQLTLVRVQ